jgi:hypothetical protein
MGYFQSAPFAAGRDDFHVLPRRPILFSVSDDVEVVPTREERRVYEAGRPHQTNPSLTLRKTVIPFCELLRFFAARTLLASPLGCFALIGVFRG